MNPVHKCFPGDQKWSGEGRPEMERGGGARNGAWGDQQDRIETIQKRSRKFRDTLVLVFRTSPSLGLR